MTAFYVRLDEADKTDEQLKQRDDTYAAVKALKALGIRCRVVEHFTGKCERADAASIVIKMDSEQ